MARLGNRSADDGSSLYLAGSCRFLVASRGPLDRRNSPQRLPYLLTPSGNRTERHRREGNAALLTPLWRIFLLKLRPEQAAGLGTQGNATRPQGFELRVRKHYGHDLPERAHPRLMRAASRHCL